MISASTAKPRSCRSSERKSSVRETSGAESSYRIVGVDETDIDRNWVSWLSPIAKALLNARVGQRVRFKFPSGEAELEIVSVAYE